MAYADECWFWTGLDHLRREYTPVSPSETMEGLPSYFKIVVDHPVECFVIVIAALLFVRALPWILSPRVPAVELAVPAGTLALSFGPDLHPFCPSTSP